MGNPYKNTYAENVWAELRGTRMLKVSFGQIKENGASETEEQRKIG